MAYVIDFSTLPEEQKKKYMKFLNDNKIQVGEENLLLKIEKIPMPLHHQARQYSALNDIKN